MMPLYSLLLLCACTGAVYGRSVLNGTLDLSGKLTSTTLDPGSFPGCSGTYETVTELVLTNNSIVEISNDTFQYFYNLKRLDLSHNQVRELPDDVFLPLWQLETLKMTHNNLARLSASLLQNKYNLVSVNFDYNNISEVEFGFVNAEHEHLLEVSVQYNSLEVFEPWPYQIYKHDDNFIDQIFHLEHNKIREFKNSYNWHYDLQPPHNRLVHLMYNEIESAEIPMYSMYFANVSDDVNDFYIKYFTLKLNTTLNPFHCDCHLYTFANALRNSFYKWVDVEEWQMTCASPPEVYGEDWLRLVPYEKMVCNLTQDCPPGCFCQARPYDGSTFVNCTAANLQEMPDTLPTSDYKDLVLILDDNHIQELKATNYAQNILNISLARNRMHSLDADIVKSMTRLKKIDLRGNSLKELPKEIQRLDFGDVTLEGNPLRCHCDMTWMGDWIRIARDTTDKELRCTEDGGQSHRIVDVTLELLKCTKKYLIPLFVAIGIFLIGCVIAGIAARRCPYETKVLLYKFACIHPGDRYEVDEDPDKEYDVYFSYDHEEYDIRQWIKNILLKKLQKKFKSIRTYNPLIDFDGSSDTNGKYEEFDRAMEKSKRILIILSSGSFVPDNRQEYEILDCEIESGKSGNSY